MENEHSPGPWKAVYRHGGPDYHIIVDSRGVKIAEVFGETNGNGYLIESAPELLDALRHVYARLEIEELENPGGTYLCAAMRENIASVIRKATGEIE